MSSENQRILYIDPFLPLHDRNSGSLRLYGLLQLLRSDGHEVSYLPHTIWAGHEKYAQDLTRLGIEVLAPPEGTHTDASVTTALNGKTFDTVIISFYNFAAVYAPFIRRLCPTARVVIDTIDLHFVRERRMAQTTGDPALAAKAEETYKAEIASYSNADALIAISDVERRTLLTEIPTARMFVIPNVHEIPAPGPGYEERNGLLFVGNFWHPPNAEGIVWFCAEVWPRVIRKVPTMTLDVVGQDPPPALMRFVNNHVRVHGWVPKLDPFLNTTRLSIAPLLHGAGLKGKVGEALAAGLPVVTTSIGAEGLNLRDNESALVADSAEAFADAIVKAHQSPTLWQTLATNGRDVIRSSYTPDAVRTALRALVPSPGGPVAYFGIPDWNDLATVESVLSNYLGNVGTNTSVLHFGLIDIEAEEAFAKLCEIISKLGYDPSSIPDVTLTPLSSLDLGFLKPTTIWVPMRSDVDKPAHVMSSNLVDADN